MADGVISVEKAKAFWRSQVQDERNWEVNKSLLRAAGMFVGAIILMREFGDLMAV